MSNPLAWTGAIGGAVAAAAGIIAAIGAWRTEITARWQARAERLRTDEAREPILLQPGPRALRPGPTAPPESRTEALTHALP